jgi:hypothetical protein
MDELAAKYGARFEPARSLREAARDRRPIGSKNETLTRGTGFQPVRETVKLEST